MFLAAVDVSLDELDRACLLGGSIDIPRSGSPWNAKSVPIEGWVVGRNAAVSRVRARADERVIGEARVVRDRPDVAAHLGDARALRSGFRLQVDTTGLTTPLVSLEVLLRSGRTARLGSLIIRYSWLAGAHPAERGVVSIVIPAFNHAHFLGEALASAVGQTHPGIEVVVVDDGSTDNTAEVVRRYPEVRYIRQENRGLAEARNTGIQRSNGEFILFLDADDRLVPEAAAIGVAHLRERPECAFVSGGHRGIGIDGHDLSEGARPTVTRDHYLALLSGNYIWCPATVLYRRAALATASGFDPDPLLRACEDYDLYLRLARVYPVGAHDSLVVEYRKHGANMSDDPRRMLSAALEALRRQAPFTRNDPRRRAAIASGRAFWRGLYGQSLAALARQQLRRPGLRREGWRSLKALARLAPGQLSNVL